MNTQILERLVACALMCFSVASLSGCDQPPQSNTASQSRTSTPEVSKVEDGTSRTLTRVEGTPVHNLERIQNVISPYGQQKISISSVSDTQLTGWAVDGLAKKEAGGVDIVIDGKIYKANYGSDRPDVSEALKFPATRSGFSLVMPRDFLSSGSHTVSVRVITNDGKNYAEGQTLTFVAE
jgi:hypothetical protein